VNYLLEKVCIHPQQHPTYNASAAVDAHQKPLPCLLMRNRLARKKWCAIMLKDSTPPAYFGALLSYCLSTQNNQML